MVDESDKARDGTYQPIYRLAMVSLSLLSYYILPGEIGLSPVSVPSRFPVPCSQFKLSPGPGLSGACSLDASRRLFCGSVPRSGPQDGTPAKLFPLPAGSDLS